MGAISALELIGLVGETGGVGDWGLRSGDESLLLGTSTIVLTVGRSIVEDILRPVKVAAAKLPRSEMACCSALLCSGGRNWLNVRDCGKRKARKQRSLRRSELVAHSSTPAGQYFHVLTAPRRGEERCELKSAAPPRGTNTLNSYDKGPEAMLVLGKKRSLERSVGKVLLSL